MVDQLEVSRFDAYAMVGFVALQVSRFDVYAMQGTVTPPPRRQVIVSSEIYERPKTDSQPVGQ